MRQIARLIDLQPLVGEAIAVSDWTPVTQERVDQFATATGDHQWIHTDPVRAASGPFGTPVAHGLLTLSLLPQFFETAFGIGDVRASVNMGYDRVRFVAPVPVDSRLRARFKLLEYQSIEDGAQLKFEATIEREGSDKPACIAQCVVRRLV